MKKRIIAFALTLSTALGAFGGCGSLFNSVLGIEKSDNDTKYIVKRLEENGYTETVYPKIGASTMRVTLSDKHMDEFYALVDRCEEMYLGGSADDKEAFKRLLLETNSYLKFIDAQDSIAYLLYHCDMRDEQALERYNYTYDCYLNASSYFYEFAGLRNTVSNRLTDTLDTFSEDVLQLIYVDEDLDDIRRERQNITIEFDGIDDPGNEEKREELYKIYTKYVKNSYNYARAYGYKNYYQYMCDGDYTAKDKEAFREYVKRYIVPLCIEYRKGYKAFDASLSEKEYNISVSLDAADYRVFNRKLYYNYFDSLGEKVGGTMKEMLTRDIILTPKGENCYSMPLINYVGDTPIYYFPSGTAIDVLMMESAAYCGNRLHETTSDELESLYAYSNMLLFIAYLDGKVNDRARDSYAYYRLYEQLYQIIGCTVKDEFDEIIFNNSNPGSISLAEMDRYMELLIEEYRVAEYGGAKAVDQLRTYWSRRGVYDSCCMLSKAISLCASLDIYAEAVVDYDAAAKTFCFIMENTYSKSDFLGTMSMAGISSPFREEFYTGVCERLAWKEEIPAVE